jgi:hypothetical protein
MSEQKISEASRLSAVSEHVQPDRLTLDKDICTLGRSSVCDIVVDLVLQDQDLIGLSSSEPMLVFEDADPTIQLAAGRLRYDPKVMTFFLNFRKVELTPSEFKLLRFLYQYAGQVCTRERCAEAIWEHEYEPDPDNDPLNRVVSNLRQKLKKIDPGSDLIETHRGVGYILRL